MTRLTLVFGNKNYSSWSLRPWIFLKQNNIEFTEQRIALFTDTTDQALERYGSDYKVPILLDGELVVWDSLSILEYLSENHLDGLGWPEDRRARAVARSISAEMHSSFTNVRNEMPMNCRKRFSGIEFTNDALREVERIKTLWRHCREQYGVDGHWLFGKFSIADAMFAPIALRFYGYNISLQGSEKQYVDHIMSQVAVQEWIAAARQETEVIEQDEI